MFHKPTMYHVHVLVYSERQHSTWYMVHRTKHIAWMLSCVETKAGVDSVHAARNGHMYMYLSRVDGDKVRDRWR